MQDPNSIVLCSAVSEIFLRKLAKQGYIRYTEGSEFVDTREDLIADGDPEGGGLKELDEKNRNRIENLKDMVLYRFGSTGVNQVLSKAAAILGLTPVFPVRNTTTFGSGASDSKAVFRDCVLVKKGSTVADVGKKIMGDAPIAYIEGVGNTRVAEEQVVSVGKNDVSSMSSLRPPFSRAAYIDTPPQLTPARFHIVFSTPSLYCRSLTSVYFIRPLTCTWFNTLCHIQILSFKVGRA